MENARWTEENDKYIQLSNSIVDRLEKGTNCFLFLLVRNDDDTNIIYKLVDIGHKIMLLELILFSFRTLFLSKIIVSSS